MGVRSANILSRLENLGVITYRKFADEYRVWQGTDVDLQRLIDTVHQKLEDEPLLQVLSQLDNPQPQVATRHSAENDVLRVFVKYYINGGEEVKPLSAFSPYDGQLLLVVDHIDDIPTLIETGPLQKPTVAAIPCDVSSLNRVAREFAAMTQVLNQAEVESDWVARSELAERIAEAEIVLKQTISTTFGTGTCRWVLIDGPEKTELRAQSVNSAISEAADRAFPSSPIIHNEMLNRTDLSTQSVRARRILLEAMINFPEQENLGLQGYGPEVAMYLSFLFSTGLHRREENRKRFMFGEPSDTKLLHVWHATVQTLEIAKSRRVNLRDIYSVLLMPPFGLKLGVVPVFLTAVLQTFQDEVAIYEHGTFTPILTPELLERLVRNPGHFEIKHFANVTGARLQVANALSKCLHAQSNSRNIRVGNVLSIVSHLVRSLRNLDNFSRKTSDLPDAAKRIREAIATAVEPDELLFESLPTALGFPSVRPDEDNYVRANEYGESVKESLVELVFCQERLLNKLYQFLLETCSEVDHASVIKQAQSIDTEILDPSVRALIGTLANNSSESNIDWIRAIATVVTEKAPSEWTDEDVTRFLGQLPIHIGTFQRLVALYASVPPAYEQGKPIDVFRIVISHLDGTEHAGTVQLDQSERRLLDNILDEVLSELESSIGSPRRIHQTLLAVLGSRLLSTQKLTSGNAST